MKFLELRMKIKIYYWDVEITTIQNQ